MKKIKTKEKYINLLRLLVASDSVANKSIIRTVILNKLINYLYLASTGEEKKEILNLLKKGINNNFLYYAFEKLEEKDLQEIAGSAVYEVTEIFNNSIINITDGD